MKYKPHISYYDFTNETVKYATKEPYSICMPLLVRDSS